MVKIKLKKKNWKRRENIYRLINFYIGAEATGAVLQENVFLEISQNSLENTCTRASFSSKVAGLRWLPLKGDFFQPLGDQI